MTAGPDTTVDLRILRLGDCCCPYDVIAPGVHDGLRSHIPVSSYLIRLHDDTLVLVDTGMSRLHIEDPGLTWRGTAAADALVPVMRPEDSLLHRLAELDLGPADIDYVVNTHLHFDHAGNNDLLAGATFLVQREQYKHAKGNPDYPNRYWALPSLRYELIDGAATPWPGVELLPTPGHSPGHQSVGLRLVDTGEVVICGDAVYCEDNFTHDAWDGQADPVTARASALALRRHAEERSAWMLYGHDAQQARGLRWSPAGRYA